MARSTNTYRSILEKRFDLLPFGDCRQIGPRDRLNTDTNRCQLVSFVEANTLPYSALSTKVFIQFKKYISVFAILLLTSCYEQARSCTKQFQKKMSTWQKTVELGLIVF